MIRPLRKGDAKLVAGLHLQELRTHLRGWAGGRLLACYYRAVAEGHGACGYVSLTETGNISGFICGVWDRKCLHRTLLRQEAPRLLFWSALHLLLHPGFLARVLERQRSFHAVLPKERAGPYDASSYELRPIVVRADSRGQGVASDLLHQLVEDAHTRGFASLGLCTEVDNERANAFYRKAGFLLAATDAGYNYYWMRVPCDK
jgi:ribosomal protein S18 acetylase RimI-like enzyme